MSNISKNAQNKLTSSSDHWLQYFKQAKIDLEQINKALLNNVEVVDNENIQLKEAIRELISDLKEKENSLDQSQKIITKIKDEYTKIMKEYQELENENKNLENEITKLKKENTNIQKTFSSYEKKFKQNEALKTENEQLKKNILNVKSTLVLKTTELNKKEKENNDKELLLSDLKTKSENLINMIKEREKLIQDYNKRIEELNETIIHKDNQLKVMLNFSKNINNENKTNVKELTKQAVQTIKLFYNTLNVHNDSIINNNTDKNGNCSYLSVLNREEDEKYFRNIINGKKENIEKNIRKKLKDGLECIMYIPDSVSSIPKEFLIDMNFKNELMKFEMFSSYLREMKIVDFLKDVFSKIKINKEEGTLSFDEICAKVMLLKKSYEDLIDENNSLKKDRNLLKDKKEELNLFIEKTTKEGKNLIKKLKEKIEIIEKGHIEKIQQLKNTIQNCKNKNLKDIQILKNEIDLLRNQITKSNAMKTFDVGRVQLSMLRLINENNFTINSSKKKILVSPLDLKNLNNNHNFQTFQPQNESYRSNGSCNNNLSFQLNDSFNEKNYRLKKIENEHLKDEISRLKNEIGTLLFEMNEQRETKGNCLKCQENEKFITNELNFDKFSQILNFYTNLNNEFLKISKSTSDVLNQISEAENNLVSKKNEKMKISQTLNILKEIQKLIQIISKYIDKFSKYNLNYSKDLQKLFNFIAKSIYNQSITLNNGQLNNYKPSLINLSEINKKIFSSSELIKIYHKYENKGPNEIIQIFKITIKEIKETMNNYPIDYDSEFTEKDDNILVELSSDLCFSNSSYKIVSLEIKKLKKYDIERKAFNEIIKHYLISLEIIYNISHNLDYINTLNKNFEEAIMYKIDDIDDDGIFLRKLCNKLFSFLLEEINVSIHSL